MERFTYDDGPPSDWMRAPPVQPPPVNIAVSVQPRFTISNRQDGLATLVVGLVLGLAAALLMSQGEDRPRQ